MGDGCGLIGLSWLLYYRSMEEVGALKRKLEKYKSGEWMTAGDEVLLEEIRMYKVIHYNYTVTIDETVRCSFNPSVLVQ